MEKQESMIKIISKLEEIFPERKRGSIQARLSQLSNTKGITRGAAAEMMARQRNRTVGRLLDEEDKKCLRNNEIRVLKIKSSPNKKEKKIISFVHYDTDKKFLKLHIDEINNCYTHKCYTATFILIRKVLENLIVEMIKHKFPSKSKSDREIYLDASNKWRIRGFSDIIKDFRKKCKLFEREEERLVLRILQLSKKFKEDADNKTHCLYHISNKNELKEADPQHILDLIKEFFDEY